jgi:hypothetical protein
VKYEFKNLQTGQPCCNSDNIKHLCDANCLPQALAASPSTLTVAAQRPGVVPLTDAQQAQVAEALAIMAGNAAAQAPPPPVPSLVDAINARRNGQPVAVAAAPVFGSGVKPYPAVAAQYGDVPDPPSLTAEILRRRAR